MTTAAGKIISGLDEAIAHARGNLIARERSIDIPDAIDVRAVRSAMGMSQAQFSMTFGFKLDTVRNWEQAKRVPTAQARALLKIIGSEPEAVKRALAVG